MKLNDRQIEILRQLVAAPGGIVKHGGFADSDMEQLISDGLVRDRTINASDVFYEVTEMGRDAVAQFDE